MCSDQLVGCTTERGLKRAKKQRHKNSKTGAAPDRRPPWPEVAAISELESKLIELRSQLQANAQEWKDASM